MNQIKAKVYYEVATGNVLTVTSEMSGTVEQTTKEQDMAVYPDLKDKKPEDIDFIELDYGTLASTFNNVKSYSINLETKALNLIYFTAEELQAEQTQAQASQDLNTRVSDISNYLLSQTDMISGIEDQILQTEINKLTEGMN